MPMVQTDEESIVRVELKSAPPDGYVVLRRLPYGKWLERRAMTKLQINTQRGAKDVRGELALMDKKVTLLEFAECIQEHNLQMKDGSLFNFKDPTALEQLDSRVGDEIGNAINELHAFEEGN